MNKHIKNLEIDAHLNKELEAQGIALPTYSLETEKLVNDFFAKWGFNVTVKQIHDGREISIVECEEYHPVGENDLFTVIVKNGKVYNKDFEDLEEFYKDSFGEEE